MMLSITVDARCLPNGKGVMFTSIELGHKPRIYTQEFGFDSPWAISLEGVRGAVPLAGQVNEYQ
jgi:hypothetical protein